MTDSIAIAVQLPPLNVEAGDDMIAFAERVLDGIDWFSDYDGGIAIGTGRDDEPMLRANPCDYIVREDDGVVVVTPDEFNAKYRSRLLAFRIFEND